MLERKVTWQWSPNPALGLTCIKSYDYTDTIYFIKNQVFYDANLEIFILFLHGAL